MRYVLATIFLAAAVLATPTNIPVNSLRIFDGKQAARNQFPFQVSVQFFTAAQYNHLCGGAIIGPTWILTAAHCLYNFDVTHLSIKAGILLLNDEDIPGEQIVTVQAKFIHPSYQTGTYSAYDIALLQLSATLKYTVDNVKAINIPAQEALYVGNAYLPGWGLTTHNGSLSNALLYMQVPIVSGSECKEILTAYENIGQYLDVDYNICSGFTAGHESSCSGDSGGPLVQDNVVVGVSSWGIGTCINKDVPSIYTRVAAFSQWIVQTTDGTVRP